MMIMNVINQPTSVVVELNTIAKIHKYKRLHEEHHFISMAMEVHNTPEHDMDCFIRECAHLFHNKQSKGHLSFFLHSIFQVAC
jgi:antirestriction protein